MRWVVPKENGGYSFMVMRKRLDCERMGGEGITAGRGEMGMGGVSGGFGRGIVVVWRVGWWDCQMGMEWR